MKTPKLVKLEVVTVPDSDIDLSQYAHPEDFIDVSFMGVRAKASFEIYSGSFTYLQTLESCGLWQVNTAEQESYIKQIFEEEANQLKDQLSQLNIDVSNFEALKAAV